MRLCDSLIGAAVLVLLATLPAASQYVPDAFPVGVVTAPSLTDAPVPATPAPPPPPPTLAPQPSTGSPANATSNSNNDKFSNQVDIEFATFSEARVAAYLSAIADASGVPLAQLTPLLPTPGRRALEFGTRFLFSLLVRNASGGAAPTNETQVLAAAVAAGVAAGAATRSSPLWRATVVAARHVWPRALLPPKATLGVSYLWVAFIAVGIAATVGTVYVLTRVRSDTNAAQTARAGAANDDGDGDDGGRGGEGQRAGDADEAALADVLDHNAWRRRELVAGAAAARVASLEAALRNGATAYGVSQQERRALASAHRLRRRRRRRNVAGGARYGGKADSAIDDDDDGDDDDEDDEGDGAKGHSALEEILLHDRNFQLPPPSAFHVLDPGLAATAASRLASSRVSFALPQGAAGSGVAALTLEALVDDEARRRRQPSAIQTLPGNLRSTGSEGSDGGSNAGAVPTALTQPSAAVAAATRGQSPSPRETAAAVGSRASASGSDSSELLLGDEILFPQAAVPAAAPRVVQVRAVPVAATASGNGDGGDDDLL